MKAKTVRWIYGTSYAIVLMLPLWALSLFIRAFIYDSYAHDANLLVQSNGGPVIVGLGISLFTIPALVVSLSALGFEIFKTKENKTEKWNVKE